MKTRRRARRITLETLYEYDLVDHPPFEVLARRVEDQPLETTGLEFARRLIQGVIDYQQQMDRLIARYAPEWPLDQMAVIDRNILRMAIYEFLIADETPVKVAINEAVGWPGTMARTAPHASSTACSAPLPTWPRASRPSCSARRSSGNNPLLPEPAGGRPYTHE